MSGCSDLAWNNFVLRSDPHSCEPGTSLRAAAIANQFLGGANNGGLNSFLTVSHDLDANEVLDALTVLGAAKAACQLELVLRALGASLPSSSQADRWALLEERWHDDLDQHDVLTSEVNEELIFVLSKHVAANEEFYSALD